MNNAAIKLHSFNTQTLYNLPIDKSLEMWYTIYSERGRTAPEPLYTIFYNEVFCYEKKT